MALHERRIAVRTAAVWAALAACYLALVIVRGVVGIMSSPIRLGWPSLVTASGLAISFGAASALGLLGAWRLWHQDGSGRGVCIISGAAAVVGLGPAAVLRGQTLIVAFLGVTLCVVLSLASWWAVGRLD